MPNKSINERIVPPIPKEVSDCFDNYLNHEFARKVTIMAGIGAFDWNDEFDNVEYWKQWVRPAVTKQFIAMKEKSVKLRRAALKAMEDWTEKLKHGN